MARTVAALILMCLAASARGDSTDARTAWLAAKKRLGASMDKVEMVEPAPRGECVPPQAVALDETEGAVLEAADAYAATLTDPEDPALADVKLTKATVLWRRQHHAEAIPLLEDVIARHR